MLACGALLAFALAGCSLLPRGGQSESSASSTLSHIIGVEAAMVSSWGRINGLRWETSTDVRLHLRSGYQVSDPQRVRDYLMRVACSVNETRPTGSVFIRLESPDGVAFDSRWEDDWSQYGVDGQQRLLSIVFPGEMERKLGRWPCDVPPTPRGLFLNTAG